MICGLGRGEGAEEVMEPQDSMKWLYVGLGIVGMLVPVGVVYAVNYDRRIPGAIIDLGLLFFSAGVGIIFIPIGVGLGLALAAVIQAIWNRVTAGINP
jgi:hypothetical protein